MVVAFLGRAGYNDNTMEKVCPKLEFKGGHPVKKRILTLLLAVVMVFGVMPGAAAADTPALSVRAPEALPDVGRTFTVTVELAGNPGILSAECTLGFNAAAVQCTDVQIGSALRGMLTAANEAYSASSAKVAAAAASPAKGSGTLATFTFTVVGSGDAGLRLSDVMMTGADNQELAVTVTQASGSKTEPTKKDDTQDADEAGNGADAPQTDAALRFSDVPRTFWGYDVIERAAELGLAGGFPDGTFRPNAGVTRAQFVQMLWNLAGKPAAVQTAAFTDVPADAWYGAALSWAVEAGVAGGVGGGRFEPNGGVTRQQAMAMLFRYSGGQSGAEALFGSVYDAHYTDSGTIAGWAKPAVYWAVFNEILSGAGDGRLAPGAAATRAQVAAIFLRYMDNVVEKEDAR